jgi:transforming growth factor-beta-induced protein
MLNRITAAAVCLSVGLAASASGQCSGWGSKEKQASNEHEGASVVMASYDHHKAPKSYGATGNIVETAKSAGQFNTLLAAAKAAGLAETLMGEGPFTVFAPTDAAFSKLPDGTVETLLKPENKKLLQSILLYHVVPAKVKAEKVVTMENATTVGGQRVDIRVRNDNVFIDGAQVISTDVMASNGIIHVIDTVLMPETRNLAEVAENAGSFGTLIAAAKAAGLVPVLTGEEAYTVLAPTDEAFQALGQRTINDLLKPENKHKLAEVLKYHVIPGRVYASDALKAKNAETAQGGSVGFEKTGDRVTVNGAQVVSADIEASNGVIHVIDTVLMPK